MITFRRAAALAALALAATAPGAVAESPSFDCSYNTFGTDGDRYDGVLTGYVSGGGPGASIRCYVVVDGWEAASWTLVSGAATAVVVSYVAPEDSTVRYCAEATTVYGTFTMCAG